ncbi:dehydration-responsive element-binding protein 1F-like [Phalaenopsis equestris]|uniref:dehydration-responsive element-binding protein 1F-like n=1 Tax=Phalaenopsis equestris TaxID=78828 RepID=UPI0009E28DAC|nr:dehydration-responsive element-binding protein 1F-like [Phalaenopsis equestris]
MDSDSLSTTSGDNRTPSPSLPSPHPSPPKRRSGRKKFRVTRHPIFHGVRQRNGGKWVCEVREPHKKTRIWLGTYSTPEMAARAHDVAALALRGKSAVLNFPDSAWTLPATRSTRPEDIRRAAVKAAEMASKEISSEAGLSIGFLDEEALFNMPGMLVEMAAGLIITPPGMEERFDWDEVEGVAEEITLWEDGFWK